eukprot:gene8744-14767_t
MRLNRDKSIDDYGGCTVSGKGLIRGTVGKPTSFFVHTATLDLLYLSYGIKGPLNSELPQQSLKSDIYCIEPNLHGVVYYATHPGLYQVSIKWNGRDVCGSPFNVSICSVSQESSSDENDQDKNTSLSDSKTTE